MTLSKMKCTYEHVDKMTEHSGWFQNQLWVIEALLNGRWPYWQSICLNGTIGELPEWEIPRLNFVSHFSGSQPGCRNLGELSSSESGRKILSMAGTGPEAHKHALKTFERALDYGCNHLSQLVNWWLWAFGDPGVTERPKLSERGVMTMYCDMEIYRLIANPADWGSAITSEFLGGGKKGTAWFPTPMSIAHMMAAMTFEDGDKDTRLLSTNDPCVGTGVFLLEASNYSLHLMGCDIDPLMCSWCKFAGWLFVPWLVWGNRNMIREFREAAREAKEAREEAALEKAVALEAPQERVTVPDGKPRQGMLFEFANT